MPWGKIGDTWWRHPKVRAAAPASRALWAMALSYASDSLTDGYIPREVLPLLDATEADAVDLVRVGLFDQVIGPDETVWGWNLHDYADCNPSRVEVLGDRRLRAAARALPGLRREVRGRDGSTCRYCGRHVVWSDRRSGLGGTYDVVDPAEDVTADNLVVCCRRCAGAKAGRGLAEAGMRLGPAESPAPPRPGGGTVRPFPPRSEAVPRSDPGRIQTVSRSDPGRSQDVPGAYLGTHQHPYPSPSPRRGGDGDGGSAPADDPTPVSRLEPLGPPPAGDLPPPAPVLTLERPADSPPPDHSRAYARAVIAQKVRAAGGRLLDQSYQPIRIHPAAPYAQIPLPLWVEAVPAAADPPRSKHLIEPSTAAISA